MKAFVLSLALLSSWCHGAALTAEPGSETAKSDDAEQEEAKELEDSQDQDGIDLLSDQDESPGGPLLALKTFMAPYDEKLESITHEADALKAKLTAFRASSMARLAHKRKDYQQRLLQANQENQQMSKSNEELDKEVIRLQHQVAKKASHLQKVQDANRKGRTDIKQLADELEVVDKIFDKSSETAKAKSEEVVVPIAPTLEQPEKEELEYVQDPEERALLRSASRSRFAVQSFNRGNDNNEEAKSEQEGSSEGTAGEQKAPAKELSMLSKSASIKAPQNQADLTDMEPASLVELLNRNLAGLQKHEESSETALWQVFEKRVKRTFHERRQLRKRESALQAMKQQMTQYEKQLNLSIKKAEDMQQLLDEQITKQSKYLRKVKMHMQ